MKRFILFLLTMTTCGIGMGSDYLTLQDALTVDDAVINSGGSVRVTLKFAKLPEDGSPLKGAQFDLYLSEGLTIASYTIGGTTTYAVNISSDQEYEVFDDYGNPVLDIHGNQKIEIYHSVSTSKVADNHFRFIIVNMNNSLPMQEGGLLDITLKHVENVVVNNYVATFCGSDGTNAALNISGEDDTKYIQAPFSFNVTIPLDENKAGGYEAFNPYTGKVVVKRQISANNWNTICLPFAMTNSQAKAVFGEDVKIAKFAGCNSNMKDDKVAGLNLKFTSVETIEANKPYLIKISTPVTDPFSLEKATVVDADSPIEMVGEDSFIGTYKYITGLGSTDKPYLFLSGNKFYTAVGNTDFKPFRAYFDLKDLKEFRDNTTASSVNINFFVDDDQVTEIKGVTLDNGVVDAVYDLQGRKVKVEDDHLNTLQKGIYIINGQKVTIQ